MDEDTASVLDSEFHCLFYGTKQEVSEWLKQNKTCEAKMVGVGKDFQLISVEEYESLHG